MVLNGFEGFNGLNGFNGFNGFEVFEVYKVTINLDFVCAWIYDVYLFKNSRL